MITDDKLIWKQTFINPKTLLLLLLVITAEVGVIIITFKSFSILKFVVKWDANIQKNHYLFLILRW